MNLKETFQKQGGMILIKQYARAGCLGTAIGEFLLLGKSRTALEILRLSTQLKTKQRLEKKYRKKLDDIDKAYDKKLPHESSDKVWICWFQGIENAPELVQKCYDSVKKNLINHEIILITEENMNDYVTFPDYIIKKWKSGVITYTHLTDLLRIELLIKYGGMWLDATVLCTSSEDCIPDYFFNSDLFFFQSLKPGRDGKSTYCSSWLMSAKTNNKVLLATRELCYSYWKNENSMKDYFLLHDFLSITLDRYEDEWRAIVPRDNATPHIMLLRLFDQFDEKMWENIAKQSPFHKLTYKFGKDQKAAEGTNYKRIIEHDDCAEKLLNL